MESFKFTIVISAYNSEAGIAKCINSIIKQTLPFEENTEIILINNGSTDNTASICEYYAEKYPNINYISKRHEGKGNSKNLGISRAQGKYIHFIDGDNYLSRDTLKNVLELFEKNEEMDIVTIPTIFIESVKYTVFDEKYSSTRIINLLKQPEYIQIQSDSCFLKTSRLKKIKFTSQLKLSEDIVFINTILISNPNLGICSKDKYYNLEFNDKNAFLDKISNFKDDVKNENVTYNFKKLIEKSLEKYGYIPDFIQKTILYFINEIISNDEINEKLTEKEIEYLNLEIKNTLQHVDDANIYDQKFMDEKIKSFLLYVKNDYSYPETNQFKLNQYLKLDTVYIDIYEIIDDNLYILANINSINHDEKIDVYVNNEKIESNKVNFPQREKYYLNKRYLANHTFEFNIKLDDRKTYEIQFKSQFNQNLHIDFSRPCNFSKVAGYSKTKKYLSFLDNDKIIVNKLKTANWLKREAKTLFGMLKNRVPGFETAIPIRLIYMILYPFLKNKRIWFYMDFPTIADDNGMHLFKYSIKQNEPGIKKYFIIDKNTPDYKKMKKIGPVIGYHSLKHRILGLFAEKIITSHPDNNYIYAFWGHFPNFAGILKSSTIFLQHGITLNNICGWLNKYDKNLDFLLTASQKEYDSLFKYYYNYDKEIIKLLGFPRFDNLTDEKTKTILLMPSWRRYLNNENKYTISNSSYFITYNSLINNEKLLQKAAEYGYEIIFRPHPHVYQYIDLFDENESIKIDYERESYQELFKKGALMITDYSSVAFDFAYLKKPVLYFQYGEDYHFNLNESYFDYETMGFGEVCKSEDELIDLIVEYMENDCKMKEKHIRNVEDYFTFTDKNNCRRVHEAIKKIPPRD